MPVSDNKCDKSVAHVFHTVHTKNTQSRILKYCVIWLFHC